MAARILSQIEADRVVGPIYRKPCHYAAAHQEGLAIAIAIDDRFWTEEWDKDSPEIENIQALEGGENVSDYRIDQLLPTDGDWFALLPEYLGREEGYRYVMERVTCWALIKGEKCIDHVAAIGTHSYPLTDDINDDITFVCGRDKCPTGQTWSEVYDSVPPSRSIGWVEMPKEIVAAMHP